MPVFRLKIKIQYLPKTRNMKPQQNTSLDLKCQKKKLFFLFLASSVLKVWFVSLYNLNHYFLLSLSNINNSPKESVQQHVRLSKDDILEYLLLFMFNLNGVMMWQWNKTNQSSTCSCSIIILFLLNAVKKTNVINPLNVLKLLVFFFNI